VAGPGDELPAMVLEHTLCAATSAPLAIARAGDAASAVHAFADREPWRDVASSEPAAAAWLDAFAEMAATGLLPAAHVRAAVRAGHADRRLLSLPPPPPPANSDALVLAEHRVRTLRRELASLRLSRTWEIGRWITSPLRARAAGGSTS
jgi:hypothetical protein